MIVEKKLGKISKVEYGIDPDYGMMMGLRLEFKFPDGGVGDGLKYLNCMLTEDDPLREDKRLKTLWMNTEFIYILLKEAKVKSVSQLKNMPVEVTLENHVFKDFRILTEVL